MFFRAITAVTLAAITWKIGSLHMSMEEITGDLETLKQSVTQEKAQVQDRLTTQDTKITTLETRVAELESGGAITPEQAQELRDSIGEIRTAVEDIYTPPNPDEEETVP